MKLESSVSSARFWAEFEPEHRVFKENQFTVGSFFLVLLLANLNWSSRASATFALETAAPERRSMLQLQLQQSQYAGGNQNATQTDSYSAVGFRYQFQGMSTGLDAMALGTFDGTRQAYLALPEFYWKMSTEHRSLVVGRSRMEWSLLDQEWRLGIWQPYVRWDYIHPREQGLTGVFYSLSDDNSKLTLFASGLFLPDQGPDFQVEDGEFHSSNRWFRQPVSRMQVLNQQRDLKYQLEMPAYFDVVLQSSFGAQAQFGNPRDGWWFRSSWGSKPINQIQVGIDGYFSINQNLNPLQSVAVVHPRVARHELLTAEGGWSSDDLRAWASITNERTEAAALPEGWADSTLPPAVYSGLAVSHRLPWAGLRGHWLKYAYLLRRESRKLDQAGSGLIDSSLNRYPFQEVASLEWLAPIRRLAHRRMDLGIRYLYSIPEEGGLFSLTFQFMPSPGLRMDLGIDILGSNASVSSPSAGLMTLYQNNDRFMGAMTYVF